jgi:hypothetical protein
MPAKRRLSQRARRALIWGLAWFIAAQVGVREILQARPELADPEFGTKLARLRATAARNPGRPLVLMLGSSRVATGLRPGVLPAFEGSPGREPIVFNFAQVGAGPEMAHLSLDRLLRAGIRPDWVLVEYWPPTWTVERQMPEFLSQVNVGCLDWPAVRLLSRYVEKPRRLYRRWASLQWAPLASNREALLRALAPDWASSPTETDRRCRDLDDLGWWSPTRSVDPAERRRLVERYRRIYEPRLRRFHLERTPDRALRAILELCHRERIRASLVVLPEGEEFRKLYPEPAIEQVASYLGRLRREFGVEVVDARTWVADDGFIDGHHLLPQGASAFTLRLGREVLQPTLAAAPASLRR